MESATLDTPRTGSTYQVKNWSHLLNPLTFATWKSTRILPKLRRTSYMEAHIFRMSLIYGCQNPI
nr:unnamed protein product [Callosobruchus analis]